MAIIANFLPWLSRTFVYAMAELKFILESCCQENSDTVAGTVNRV
jgi:hypothetical protein